MRLSQVWSAPKFTAIAASPTEPGPALRTSAIADGEHRRDGPPSHVANTRSGPNMLGGVVTGAVNLLAGRDGLQAAAAGAEAAIGRPQWSKAHARTWYAKQPWLVGANYIPASAINQLEMWQAATWDPARIDLELGWAGSLGMNTMRVFLHDLLWSEDAPGFRKRIDEFLTIASRHGIKPLFVLFDSCWEANPKLGPQHPPIPGVHNSGWVQSPGIDALRDETRREQFRDYVQGVIGAFHADERILGWDLWNEPDNSANQYHDADEQKRLVADLLADMFVWARAAGPVQPLTSGVWQHRDWRKGAQLSPFEAVQLGNSDVISFHSYTWPEVLEARIDQLETHGRPIICTEYMARSVGSTFDTALPVGKRRRIGMINWGLVDGKSQTRLPWDSWQKPYTRDEPPVWFHDVFHRDGRPYRTAEADLMRKLTGRPAA